ncbi:MAG: hypothetical protein ACI4OH_05190 [Mitsuokella sp.]|uniref:hypothetical protein n=1 Tax=Mitsuokella sp. TaxID=2049034 RepID=UPI003F01091C
MSKVCTLTIPLSVAQDARETENRLFMNVLSSAYQSFSWKETKQYSFDIGTEEDAKKRFQDLSAYGFPYDVWQESDVGGYEFSLGDKLYHRPDEKDIVQPGAIDYAEILEIKSMEELQKRIQSYTPSSTIEEASEKFNQEYASIHENYRLTNEGLDKVIHFIQECAAKRKELLDAGKDTGEEAFYQKTAEAMQARTH